MFLTWLGEKGSINQNRMNPYQRIRTRLSRSSERSKEALRQIALSVCAKSISIVVPLLIVPLTINYVNPTQYGIWLTLSSIIAWVSFLDLGLGNGFRNKFAEAKAKDDKLLARKYVSTTYFAISTVVVIALIALYIANKYINWSTVLKVDASYSEELHKVFAVVCGFFCLNLIFNIFSSLLSADQKTGIAAVIHGVGQLCSLAVIWVLTQTTEGSLLNLALYFSGVPCIVLFIASIIAFVFTRYKEYAPRISLIDLSLVKNILSLGIKFFLIFLSSIAIFQIVNIVLSREIGPTAVTEYNIAYKYFGVLYSCISIIVAPFWSAFTDAYFREDFIWMRQTTRKLEKTWWLSIVVGVAMLAVSGWVYKFWIGDSVEVSFFLSVGVLVYVLAQSLGSIYMHIINGLGTIRLQLIIYCAFALVSWPLLNLLCRTIGIAGIVILPSIVYLTQAIVCKIQITKVLNHTAKGIWLK